MLFRSVSLMLERSKIFHAQGFFCYPPVILVGKLRQKRIVYDLVDFVADSFNWSRGARQAWGWWESFCAALADGVMVVDLRKQDLPASRLRATAVVPNCPEDRTHGQTLTKRPGPFTIYYGGAIYEQRGIADVGEAIQSLPQARLIVAGTGPDESALRAKFGSPGSVQFLGLLNEDESVRLTMESDLVFALYDPRLPINRRAVSAKLFDAMMCGKPVLVNAESTILAGLVTAEQCGVIVPYGDVIAIRRAIQALMDNPGIATVMGINGRKAFEREFNWNTMSRRLLHLYDEVLPYSGTPRGQSRD